MIDATVSLMPVTQSPSDSATLTEGNTHSPVGKTLVKVTGRLPPMLPKTDDFK